MKKESKIQQEIFIFAHNNHPDLITHSVPNGFGLNIPDAIPERYHKTLRIAIGKAIDLCKQIGMLEGVSDLIIHLPKGKCVMVEVKDEKGRQSPAQKKIQAKMERIGGNYILVRSLEDFKQQFKRFL